MASRVLSRCIQLGRVSSTNSSMRKCSTIPSSKNKLMTVLPEHTVALNLEFCHVYLVGTHHNSQKSVEDVQRMVRALKPEVVFLELCLERRERLTRKEIPSERPSEFRTAYEEAIKYGAKVVLGDRPHEVTTKRLLRKMTLSELINSCFSRYPSSKEMENMDMDTLNRYVQGVGKEEPIWAETLIHERDIFMAKGILNVAQKSSCVVAVVGRGHVNGLMKHLQNQRQLDDLWVDDLSTVPPPSVAEIIGLCSWVYVLGVDWKLL